jgi:hypothetical protein
MFSLYFSDRKAYCRLGALKTQQKDELEADVVRSLLLPLELAAYVARPSAYLQLHQRLRLSRVRHFDVRVRIEPSDGHLRERLQQTHPTLASAIICSQW